MKTILFIVVLFSCNICKAQYYRYRYVPQARYDYSLRLQYLNDTEAYKHRLGQLSLDHKEWKLDNKARMMSLAKREYALKLEQDSLRNQGILPKLPPRQSQSMSYGGFTFKNYQEFKDSPEYELFQRDLRLRQTEQIFKESVEKTEYIWAGVTVKTHQTFSKP